MADRDKTKQVLEETIRNLYQRAGSVTPARSNSYLQGADGQFLGKITDNPYDRESILNSYGPYGSIYSPTSIQNQYSKYGSLYSPLSVNSPYANNPPILFINGQRRGPVSKNPYQANRIETDLFLHLLSNDLAAPYFMAIPEKFHPQQLPVHICKQPMEPL